MGKLDGGCGSSVFWSMVGVGLRDGSALGGALSMLIYYALKDTLSLMTANGQGNWGINLLISRTAFSGIQQGSIGLLQWFVLRRRVYWALWIPACWLGGSVAGAVGLGLENPLRGLGVLSGAAIIISPLVGGLVAGSVMAWLFRQPKPSTLEGLVEAKLPL